MLPKNFRHQTVDIVVDTSNPLEMECLELFRQRASLLQIESKLKSYLFDGGSFTEVHFALSLDKPSNKATGITVHRPTQLVRFPKGKNFDTLCFAAQHASLDTPQLTKLLYGNITKKNCAKYYSRRGTTWKRNNWVYKKHQRDWRVTDELKRWFEDHHDL